MIQEKSAGIKCIGHSYDEFTIEELQKEVEKWISEQVPPVEITRWTVSAEYDGDFNITFYRMETEIEAAIREEEEKQMAIERKRWTEMYAEQEKQRQYELYMELKAKFENQ